MKRIWILLCGVLLLCSCAAPGGEEPPAGVSALELQESWQSTDGPPEPQEAEIIEAHTLYGQYMRAYDSWHTQFQRDMANPIALETDPIILVAQVYPAERVSTDGSVLTRYEREGQPVRYHWQIFGESGQVSYSYALLGDLVYVQCLRTTYNAPVFRPQAGTELPLYYALEDYVVDGDTVYLLDHLEQSVLPADGQLTLHTPGELEAMFDGGAPVS